MENGAPMPDGAFTHRFNGKFTQTLDEIDRGIPWPEILESDTYDSKSALLKSRFGEACAVPMILLGR